MAALDQSGRGGDRRRHHVFEKPVIILAPDTIIYFTCDDCAAEESRVEQVGVRIENVVSISPYGAISLVLDTEAPCRCTRRWTCATVKSVRCIPLHRRYTGYPKPGTAGSHPTQFTATRQSQPKSPPTMYPARPSRARASDLRL